MFHQLADQVTRGVPPPNAADLGRVGGTVPGPAPEIVDRDTLDRERALGRPIARALGYACLGRVPGTAAESSRIVTAHVGLGTGVAARAPGSVGILLG